MSPEGQGGNVTAAERFALALARHDVRLIFGQSIPSQIILAAERLGLKQIAYRTENAGAVMADGYARISGRVPVVTAQNGPAATLLVPPLAEALKASIPMVALVQDVSRASVDRNAFQELDHLELFGGCAKWVRRVPLASRIDDYVDMAFTAAASGRPGPAVLLCPLDLLGEPHAGGRSRGAVLGRYPLDRTVADPAQVAEAAGLLAGAKAPLIVAGGGVHLLGRLRGARAAAGGLRAAGRHHRDGQGRGRRDASAVARRHRLLHGHRRHGEVPAPAGRGGRRRAAASATAPTRTAPTPGSCFPPGARFIHLDIDGLEIGRNYEALRLVGDARLTLAGADGRAAGQDLGKRRAARPAARRRDRRGPRAPSGRGEAAAATSRRRARSGPSG